MKATKPKSTTTTKRSKKNVMQQMVEKTIAKGGYQLSNNKPGLKEQVKAGLVTAKQALTTLVNKVDKDGNYAKDSKTYNWLQKRAAKEGRAKEAQVADAAQG